MGEAWLLLSQTGIRGTLQGWDAEELVYMPSWGTLKWHTQNEMQAHTLLASEKGLYQTGPYVVRGVSLYAMLCYIY